MTLSLNDARDALAQIAALSASQAVIEFTPEGKIVTANDNFLKTLNYSLEEIRDKHHAMFVVPAETRTPAYDRFWSELRAGRSQSGEFLRLGRGGKQVWISASYTAVKDEMGAVVKVVKFAQDITARKVALEELIAALMRMAEGDMTPRLSERLTGEFLPLRRAFNTTLDHLCDVLADISELAVKMETETESISSDARDLARRGETQAASLEETAAAMEEISSNLNLTSESAGKADGMAQTALAKARRGEEVVSTAITSMENVDIHTRKMSEITSVIENFALQTNLLSINAAVEAARAGEVGRGFAVVATEVRNLAQQSAKASQTIADLIEKTSIDVRKGVEAVRGAGQSLTDITESVEQVYASITGIAHATREQAIGVGEVTSALGQLDVITQQNLAVSERNAATSAALTAQMRHLTEQAEGFHIDASAPPPAASRAA